jgi:hypothetical protein
MSLKRSFDSNVTEIYFKEKHDVPLGTVGEIVNMYIMKIRCYHKVHSCNPSTGEVEAERLGV